MRLDEWIGETGVFTQPYGGGVQVFHASCSAHRNWQLHHLSDYVVTATVSGPSKVLMPRANREDDHANE